MICEPKTALCAVLCAVWASQMPPCAEFADRFFKWFWQHPRLGDRGHEVGVGFPPWKNVHMQVVGHAGTACSPLVQPNVDATWLYTASATPTACCTVSHNWRDSSVDKSLSLATPRFGTTSMCPLL